ncbi:hypothetical protein PTD2_01256 [Pseudoalteromonas tunicata D2]|uniref:Uncharacterized protein n=1 Tax=Pseudoalteromonas tunicata D2 TaxID=87626 RepID=A4C3M2_9GAMM|nr:hypothetical protein PTD2_01256 [Pseudoalteromonas tunicata D2]
MVIFHQRGLRGAARAELFRVRLLVNCRVLARKIDLKFMFVFKSTTVFRFKNCFSQKTRYSSISRQNIYQIVLDSSNPPYQFHQALFTSTHFYNELNF